MIKIQTLKFEPFRLLCLYYVRPSASYDYNSIHLIASIVQNIYQHILRGGEMISKNDNYNFKK